MVGLIQSALDHRAAKSLMGAARALHERARRWRRTILVLAALGFAGGFFWSLSALSISWRDIELAPMLLLAAVIVPLSLAYSAINMQLMGRAIGSRIGFWSGLRTSAYAQVAELLPIPGGAIVRTAALMKEGGRTAESAGLVLAFALLWIACAGVGAGIALASLGLAATILLGVGAIMVVAIVTWLTNQYGLHIAVAALALRVIGIALVTARVVTAFAILGLAIGAVDALAYAFAIILGSAASIVPAGLGVGEALSALIAQPTQFAPAAAFLAVAISRMIGIAVNMLVAAAASLFSIHPSDPKTLAND